MTQKAASSKRATLRRPKGSHQGARTDANDIPEKPSKTKKQSLTYLVGVVGLHHEGVEVGLVVGLGRDGGLLEQVVALVVEDHVHNLGGAADVRAEHNVVRGLTVQLLLLEAGGVDLEQKKVGENVGRFRRTLGGIGAGQGKAELCTESCTEKPPERTRPSQTRYAEGCIAYAFPKRRN